MTLQEKTIIIKMLAMIRSLANRTLGCQEIVSDCDALAKELEQTAIEGLA